MRSVRSWRINHRKALAAVFVAFVLLMQLPLSAFTAFAAAPASAPTTDDGRAQGSCPGYFYRVRPGNTLYSIARVTGTTVNSLMRANGISNPNRIYVGQWLCIPKGHHRPHRPVRQCVPTGAYSCHVVQKGETLFSIARLYGTSVQCLMTINHIVYPNVIFAGESIRIGFCSD